jgi:transcriptional regulator with XRE-family HTH domain
MTQQQLAGRVGVHVVQLRRYEAGTSQPTLDVIRSMAVALGINADLAPAPDPLTPPAAPELLPTQAAASSIPTATTNALLLTVVSSYSCDFTSVTP